MLFIFDTICTDEAIYGWYEELSDSPERERFGRLHQDRTVIGKTFNLFAIYSSAMYLHIQFSHNFEPFWP